MATMKRFIALIVCFSFLSAGCTASISRQGYVVDDTNINQPNCPEIIIVRSLDYDPALVEVAGKISAGDTGFSVTCSESFVVDTFKKDACAVGADVVNITEDSQPGFWSTCYRAEAELLRIKDRKHLADLKENPRYSTQNVGNRSKYTECMNNGIVVAGVLGGLVGGLILHSVCKSRHAEEDDQGDQSAPSIDKAKSQELEKGGAVVP